MREDVEHAVDQARRADQEQLRYSTALSLLDRHLPPQELVRAVALATRRSLAGAVLPIDEQDEADEDEEPMLPVVAVTDQRFLEITMAGDVWPHLAEVSLLDATQVSRRPGSLSLTYDSTWTQRDMTVHVHDDDVARLGRLLSAALVIARLRRGR